ncbi:Rossmann-like domain-containing protein [Solidesulfovibrio sp.]|uniref:Rossmann-like domain-containing protein n=1 Tax=Solidesulfovibrio sp. TaxID=2910990 RepID=UPI002B20852F|nr:DUF364 domain-containing protein [Solidesulfovibrio sp.]MEA5088256.1 DUF364 domain-containing protein [Solidesulfovibrio sp.]
MNDASESRESPLPAGEWLFEAAAAALSRHLGTEAGELRIDRLVVGVFATGVRLSDGRGGVAYTPPELVAQASRRILRGGLLRLRGLPALAVVTGRQAGPFAPVVRLAALNALSVPVLERLARDGSAGDGEGEAFAPLVAGRRVCMVGAMVPLIKRLLRLGPAALTVADRKAETLAEVAGCSIVDVARLDEALAACQTAVFTGASIANDSLPRLLAAVSPGAAVAVAGPTAGFVPDPRFDRGVTLVATTVVTDADEALDILAEGGGLYPLFGRCLRKVNLLRPGPFPERRAGCGPCNTAVF